MNQSHFWSLTEHNCRITKEVSDYSCILVLNVPANIYQENADYFGQILPELIAWHELLGLFFDLLKSIINHNSNNTAAPASPPPPDSDVYQSEDEDIISTSSSSSSNCIVYLETICNDKNIVTDYTFYGVVSKSSTFDITKSPAAMLEWNTKNVPKTAILDYTSFYKNLTTQSQLINLLNTYLNNINEERIAMCYAKQMDDEQNSFLAFKNFFSFTNMITTRSSDAKSGQSIIKFVEINDNLMNCLIFTDPTYVYRISGSDISYQKIATKLLPNKQALYMRSTGLILQQILVPKSEQTNVHEFTIKYGNDFDKKIQTQTKAKLIETISQLTQTPTYNSNLSINKVYTEIQYKEPELGYTYGDIRKQVSTFKNAWVKVLNTSKQLYRNKVHIERVLYLLTQHYAFQVYNIYCTGKCPELLSEIGRTIINFTTTNNLYKRPRAILARCANHPTIDIFGAYEIFMRAFLTRFHSVIHLQSDVLLMLKYSYDAFRLAISLHLNLILHSEGGGSGKSFVMYLVQTYKINGTQSFLSYRSDKALASSDNGNHNGNSICMEEIPLTLLQSSDKMNSEKASALKDLLTTGMVNATVLAIDPDTHVRKTLQIRQQHIHAFTASCNIQNFLSVIDPAIATRFHIKHYSENTGLDDQMLIMRLDELLQSKDIDINITHIIRFHQTLQSMIFHIFNLIYCEALTSVSLHIVGVFIPFLCRYLTKKGYPSITHRILETTIYYTQIEVIRDALLTTFFEKGCQFEYKSITVDDFKLLDRKLYCNLKHIVNAVFDRSDLFIDPFEYQLRYTLKQLYLNRDMSRQRVQHDWSFNREQSDKVFVEDPTYSVLPFQKFDDLISNILHAMTLSKQKFAIIPSADVIKDRLRKWQTRTVEGPTYIHDPNRPDTIVAFGPSIPNRKVARIEYKKQKTGGFLKIYRGFLLPEVDGMYPIEKPKDVLTTALLEFMKHKHQQTRTLTVGTNLETPSCVDILNIPTPSPDAPELIINRYISEDIDESIIYTYTNLPIPTTNDIVEGETLVVDIDLYALQERNKVLHITPSGINPDIFILRDPASYNLESYVYTTNEDFAFFGAPLNTYIDIEKFDSITTQEKINIEAAFLKSADEIAADLERPGSNTDYDFNAAQYIKFNKGEEVYPWISLPSHIKSKHFKKRTKEPIDHKLKCWREFKMIELQSTIINCLQKPSEPKPRPPPRKRRMNYLGGGSSKKAKQHNLLQHLVEESNHAIEN